MEEFYKELHDLLKKYESELGTAELLDGALNIALLFNIRSHILSVKTSLAELANPLTYVHPDGSKMVIQNTSVTPENPKSESEPEPESK